MQIAMILIRECFYFRTPAELLWNMEWWEVTICWNKIVKGLNDVAEKNQDNYNNNSIAQGTNKPYQKGNTTTTPITRWKRPKAVSDYTKKMREKILKGEL